MNIFTRLLAIVALAAPLVAQIKDIKGTDKVKDSYPDINNNFRYLDNSKAGISTCSAGSFVVQTTSLGIVCSQIQWSELTSKPSVFAPSTHKTSHATGGTDALAPSDIGAENQLTFSSPLSRTGDVISCETCGEASPSTGLSPTVTWAELEAGASPTGSIFATNTWAQIEVM